MLPCAGNNCSPWTMGAIGTLAVVTLIAVNSLAINGHLNALTIGCINAAIFAPLFVFAILALNNSEETPSKLLSIALMTFSFAVTLLSALGIANIVSAPSVGWSFIAPMITIVGLGVVGTLVYYSHK